MSIIPCTLTIEPAQTNNPKKEPLAEQTPEACSYSSVVLDIE